jgi:predicted phage tail protein
MIDPLSLGLGAVGLASKLYGGIKSAQANKEAQAQLDKQFEQNEAFYNNRVNKNFLETNAAKGVVEQLRKNFQNQTKQIDSKTAVTGGTAESNIAAKTAATEQVNDGLNQVAQQGTGYQLAAEGQYKNTQSDLYRQRMALNREKSQNASNIMGAGGELLGTAAKTYALHDFRDVFPDEDDRAKLKSQESGRIDQILS